MCLKFSSSRNGIMPRFKKSYWVVVLFLFCLFLEIGSASAQEGYLVGEEQKLEFIVHIMGEVKRPGEYRVPDNTNVLELLSKAGGPTEYSKLGSVTISRQQYNTPADGWNGNDHLAKGNEVIRVNLDDFLKKDNSQPPPLLKPGDVVLVPRNSWSTWRNVSTIVRDLSVVASLYLLYLRVK